MTAMPANRSAPYATGRVAQNRQAPRKHLIVYPEVAPPPMQPQPQQRPALGAPQSTFGPHPFPQSAAVSPTAVGTGTAFWDPVVMPATHHYPVHTAASPLYFAPPAAAAPEPPYPPRPGYSRIAKQPVRPQQQQQQYPPGTTPFPLSPAIPGGLYPQSAPISPAVVAHDMMPLPHPLNVGEGGYFSPGGHAGPMSAPAPPQTAFGSGQQMPPPPLQMPSAGPQALLSSRPSGGGTYSPMQSSRPSGGDTHSPMQSSRPHYLGQAPSRLQIAYLRNKDRKCDRTSFSTLYHCLRPVDLVDKSTHLVADNRERHRGNLFPLFKVNEDWVAPNVGLLLKNKPGYRCILYVVDGTLLYDNAAPALGLSGERLLSKGTLHMFTATRSMSIYARNPSKTHRAHILRMWVETGDYPNTPVTPGSDGAVAAQLARNRQLQPPTVVHPDYSAVIRHVADGDKLNCLLVIAQPGNYVPSFGMTSRIYGPAPRPAAIPKDSLAQVRAGAASPEESSYYMSQSMVFTRPDYFTPEPMEIESEMGDAEWDSGDPQLTSRACVDPLRMDEDVFVSLCQLESGQKVVYEPYDLHDKERATQRRTASPSRGGYRRVWIQTLLGDLNAESSANGGRLCVSGDMPNRMRPGDSAYVRRLDLSDTLELENCGRAPIELAIVETQY
ncbi:hypothetical protein IWQ57_003103 [Coemansia nantahalensis]|uniref:Uncharacterized protein n=1 Tax=Coemansia nantahalensis TaxID=2789366 RepID=A0ACC1JXT0_9FUNG|nr:hypothetical protein IWQ57_003103 [Coemansia nantahalensis]